MYIKSLNIHIVTSTLTEWVAYSSTESDRVVSNLTLIELVWGGGGDWAHRPSRIQTSPLESSGFLVIFKQCTSKELYRWILTYFFSTQLGAEGRWLKDTQDAGARNKDKETGDWRLATYSRICSDTKIHLKNPTRCNNISKFYYSIFIWNSTCFGRHTAHHEEPKTTLAASGFFIRGRLLDV
jgi:hypothetical protein